MDWSNERYVRLYTRDTADWLVLGWEAQALFMLMLRKVDRTGYLECRRGTAGLAALVRMPTDVVERVLPDLMDDGCIEKCEDGFIIPNFIEAQEASMSPSARTRESRERRREELRRGLPPAARETAIYFVRSVDGGPIKIGHAEDTAKRLMQLQSGRPDVLEILVAVPGTTDDEKALHDCFAAHRLKGEWFAEHSDVLELVGHLKTTPDATGETVRAWIRSRVPSRIEPTRETQPGNGTQPGDSSLNNQAVPIKAIRDNPTPNITGADPVSDPDAYRRSLVVAANMAREQRYGPNIKPIDHAHLPSGETARIWWENGVGVGFAQAQIAELTAKSKSQPKSMGYYRDAVLLAWREKKENDAAPPVRLERGNGRKGYRQEPERTAPPRGGSPPAADPDVKCHHCGTKEAELVNRRLVPKHKPDCPYAALIAQAGGAA